MTTLNVQFEDSTEQVIIAYFGCPQDAMIYLHQGSMSADDSRWATYYNAQPQSAQIWLPAPVKG